MANLEVSYNAQEIERDVGDLRRVTIAVSKRYTADDHVSVADRLNLKVKREARQMK